MLNDSLGEVLECFQAGPSVRARRRRRTTTRSADSPSIRSSLFVVPSSIVDRGVLRRTRRGRLDSRLRAAPRARRRPRHRQRDVRGRPVVGGEGRFADGRRCARPARAAGSCTRGSSSTTSRSRASRGPSSAVRFARERSAGAGSAHARSSTGEEGQLRRGRHLRHLRRGAALSRGGDGRTARRWRLPTLHAARGRQLYLHGSPSNEVMKSVFASGAAYVTVTLYDGLRLARSGFESSIAYRSVVVIGRRRRDRRGRGEDARPRPLRRSRAAGSRERSPPAERARGPSHHGRRDDDRRGVGQALATARPTTTRTIRRCRLVGHRPGASRLWRTDSRRQRRDGVGRRTAPAVGPRLLDEQ